MYGMPRRESVAPVERIPGRELARGAAAKALLRRHVRRGRAGQGIQQAVAGPGVGCGGPYPLAWDEFEGG